MKTVIIESHIPHVPQELSRYFNIRRLDPEVITHQAVADADALIVRTRTRCDATLLAGSRVSFVATATIGTDHIDNSYCNTNNIKTVSAPGCNAPAVAQYVMASLLTIFSPEELAAKTIGVVGVGHVGSIVANWAAQLGMNVLRCDPPRAEAENDRSFVGLDEIACQCDIVTFHVPHTKSGSYPTHHLADRDFFSSLQHRPVIINSARGPITDTNALIDAIDQSLVSQVIIDCWENEPEISPRLLDIATIATPHIAGYSLNGKIRATSTVVNALCHHFGVDFTMTPDIPAGAARKVTPAAISGSYSPADDTDRLKSNPADFEKLRNLYNLRPEVPDQKI